MPFDDDSFKCALPVLVMPPRLVRLPLESSLGQHRNNPSVAEHCQSDTWPNSAQWSQPRYLRYRAGLVVVDDLL